MARYLAMADCSALIDEASWKRLYYSQGGSFNAAAEALFWQQVDLASGVVEAAAYNAGYTLPAACTHPVVVAATLLEWARLAYGRKGLEVPEGIQESFGKVLEQIRDGKAPLSGLEPSSQEGVGGVLFTESEDDGSAASRPPIMGGLRGLY